MKPLLPQGPGMVGISETDQELLFSSSREVSRRGRGENSSSGAWPQIPRLEQALLRTLTSGGLWLGMGEGKVAIVSWAGQATPETKKCVVLPEPS